MNKLTKEQAIVIMGFTGSTTCKFGDFQEDVEKRLGRGVWTYDFANSLFVHEVKEMYRADFLEMCP